MIEDMQDRALAVAQIYSKNFDTPNTAEWALLKLVEEKGELTGAWLSHTGASRKQATVHEVADEAADVLGFLLVFCGLAGIDVATAFNNKWGRYLETDQ